jgi:hypothetical protein
MRIELILWFPKLSCGERFLRRVLMALHYTRDGYTLRADADSVTIDPGPKPITLGRQVLAQLGLQPRDDFPIPLGAESEKEVVTGRILSALQEAIRRCRGPEEAWMVLDLRRAMILIGGLDEEIVRRMLDQEGNL